MFDSLGFGEVGVLLLLALLVIGPERLPTAVADLGRTLRLLRGRVRDLTESVSSELGPELGDLRTELRELDPRRR